MQVWRHRSRNLGATSLCDRAFTQQSQRDSEPAACCEQHQATRYRIEVVDLLENPRLAAHDDILAVPTLIRKHPLPM